MAGDWIKMKVGLRSDPAVKGIARRTGLSRFEVVGRLHAVWSWADQNVHENGYAPTVTAADIDEEADHPGFAQAMADEHWLKILSTGLTFPDFDRHNGKPAKERALTKKRMQRFRNANSVTKPSPEKRREEVISNSSNNLKQPGTKTEPEPLPENPEPKPATRPARYQPPPGGMTPAELFAKATGKRTAPNGAADPALDALATSLGMQRLPHEPDHELQQRIAARQAL